MLLSIVILVVSLVLIYLIFVNFYPSLGGDVNKERQVLYESSKQFSKGKFVNTKREVPEPASFAKMLSISRKFFFEKVENGRPAEELKVQKMDSTDISTYEGGARLIWFGHSAFLLQLDGKNILMDPMFGDVPAPPSLAWIQTVQYAAHCNRKITKNRRGGHFT